MLIHVAADGIISFFFHGRVIFPCVCVPHVHPFFCQWTFGLLPCLGYCKQCSSEHWDACILLDHVAIFGFNKPFLIQNPINY